MTRSQVMKVLAAIEAVREAEKEEQPLMVHLRSGTTIEGLVHDPESDNLVVVESLSEVTGKTISLSYVFCDAIDAIEG